jgi:hypothetical protein
MFDSGLSPALMFIFDLLVSGVVFTFVFALIFRYLPDARIGWRDVEHGAIGTTILFLIGKFIIGFYLGRSNPGEAFGAAGSLAVMLVWVYYSSMILLLGAEFTCVWAEERGSGIKPEPGAIRTANAGATAPKEDYVDTRLEGVEENPHAAKKPTNPERGYRQSVAMRRHDERMRQLRAQRNERRHVSAWRRGLALAPIVGLAIKAGRAGLSHVPRYRG